MKDSKFAIKCVIFSILIFAVSILSFYIIKNNFNAKKVININIEEKKTVDYKVYLKENNYFDGEYLSKENAIDNMYFITSLIKFLDLKFTYSFKLDSDVSGISTYYIKAIVEANKANDLSGKYWSKEFNLTDVKTANIVDNSVLIDESIKIDYDKYNDLLTGFKKQYGLAADGVLKVVLVVDNLAINDELTNDIKRNSQVTFSIPLSQLAVQAVVDSNDGSVVKDNVVEETRINSVSNLLLKVFGLFLVIIDLLLMICLSNTIQKYKLRNLYRLTVKKILSSYDNIIVTVNNKPDLSEYNVVYVKNFDELLDAHNEVRMPINYYESSGKYKCEFYLISEKFAWVYRLEDKNMKRNRFEVHNEKN